MREGPQVAALQARGEGLGQQRAARLPAHAAAGGLRHLEAVEPQLDRATALEVAVGEFCRLDLEPCREVAGDIAYGRPASLQLDGQSADPTVQPFDAGQQRTERAQRAVRRAESQAHVRARARRVREELAGQSCSRQRGLHRRVESTAAQAQPQLRVARLSRQAQPLPDREGDVGVQVAQPREVDRCPGEFAPGVEQGARRLRGLGAAEEGTQVERG
ncbi:MAG: hypothetical protein ACK559_11755 [bacterium]